MSLNVHLLDSVTSVEQRGFLVFSQFAYRRPRCLNYLSALDTQTSMLLLRPTFVPASSP